MRKRGIFPTQEKAWRRKTEAIGDLVVAKVRKESPDRQKGRVFGQLLKRLSFKWENLTRKGGVSMKKIIALMMVFVVLASVIAGCKPTAPTPEEPVAPTPEEPIVLRGQTHFAAAHAYSLTRIWWSRELEKRTGGKVQVKMELGSPYCPHAESSDMVRGG